MCKVNRWTDCSGQYRYRTTYQCSSARASYSAYCSNPKVKAVSPTTDLEYHIDQQSGGACIIDPEDYLIGSGAPPYNIFYRRCDGTCRNARNQRMR